MKRVNLLVLVGMSVSAVAHFSMADSQVKSEELYCNLRASDANLMGRQAGFTLEEEELRTFVSLDVFEGDNFGTIGSRYDSGRIEVTPRPAGGGGTAYQNRDEDLDISAIYFMGMQGQRSSVLLSGKFKDKATGKPVSVMGTYDCHQR